MGLVDFVLGAGEKLFGKAESDQERSAKLENRVRKMGLPVEMLKIDVKGDIATVQGTVESQATRRLCSPSAIPTASPRSTTG